VQSRALERQVLNEVWELDVQTVSVEPVVGSRRLTTFRVILERSDDATPLSRAAVDRRRVRSEPRERGSGFRGPWLSVGRAGGAGAGPSVATARGAAPPPIAPFAAMFPDVVRVRRARRCATVRTMRSRCASRRCERASVRWERALVAVGRQLWRAL
jgi:hypothetical protein